MRRWDLALLYALTIAGYPLVSALPTFLGVESGLASLTYRGLYLALSGVVLMRNVQQGQVYLGSLWFPLGLFWILYTGRLMWDTVFNPVSLQLPGPEYFIWAFGTCFIPMLAFLGEPDDQMLDAASQASLIAAAVACTLALYVSYKALTTGESTTYATGRLETDTLNPISLGHLGVSTAVLAAISIPRRQGWSRMLLASVVLLGLFALIASASRGPIVALGLVLMFQLGFSMRSKPLLHNAKSITLILVLGAMLTRGAFLVQEKLGFRAVDRIVALHDLRADASTEVRLDAAQGAWHQFLEHPVFGSGLEETRSHEYPHNVVIESFMTTGVVGGVAFCMILICSGVAAGRLMMNNVTRWIALLFIQYLVAALLSGALYLSGTMWCFAAAVIALDAARRRRGMRVSPFQVRAPAT